MQADYVNELKESGQQELACKLMQFAQTGISVMRMYDNHLVTLYIPFYDQKIRVTEIGTILSADLASGSKWRSGFG